MHMVPKGGIGAWVHLDPMGPAPHSSKAHGRPGAHYDTGPSVPVGPMQAEEVLDLDPLGSVVDFFNSSLPDGFKGSATFSCDAPVVVVAVNQDFSNGNFPTDRITIKGQK